MSAIDSTSEVVVKEIVENAIKDYHETIFPFLGARPLITGGDTPIGAIEFFDDVDAPDNWVKADGSVLNIADYPFLASHYEQVHGSKNFYGGNGTTTFAVPDLQGEFLRGAGTNSHTNQGSGANVGVHQNATFMKNIENSNTEYKKLQLWGSDNWGFIVSENADSYKTTDKRIDLEGVSATIDTSYTMDFGFFSSRPTNTSFLICIKAVPAGINYSLEEQEIGTWIDGKPLYQKTIDCGALPDSTTKNITTGIQNIDKVINIQGFAYRNRDGRTRLIPFIWTTALTDCIGIDYDSANDNLNIIDAFNYATNGYTNSWVTLQYTKTTD